MRSGAATKFALAALIAILAPSHLIAQTVAAPRDPQAVTWVTKSISALTGGVQANDVTIQGTATQSIGPDADTGAITLKALGTNQSRFDLSLTQGTVSEIRNIASGSPQGFWTGTDGNTHRMTDPNTVTSASWFYPALSFLSELSNSAIAASYVDEEVHNGATVVHLRFSLPSIGPDTATNSAVATFSATDFYLDPTSALPVAMVFNAHPDTNSLVNIPIEIDYSTYKAVNGFQVPFHIQKYLNGNLLLDITVQSANVNSGLSASDFSS